MSTSSVNNIGGVQTLEEHEQANLYNASSQSAVGKDTFLILLTTQLQNQDPLNPMDNNQFVSQLCEFSSLEQLTTSNDNLKNIGFGISSVSSASMVNLIGKEVRAIGDGFQYESGDKTLHYGLSTAADSVTVTITNSDGDVVLQKSMSNQEAGDQTFKWNGKDMDNQQAPAGDYSFTVTATSGEESVETTTYTQGFVDQIDFSTGIASPRVDGQTITVDKIIQILEAEQDTNPEQTTN